MRRLCMKAGCPDPVAYRGYCTAHAGDRKRESRRAGVAIYNTKRWRILRRRVLFEQPLCSCGEIATDVDHVEPLADGGAAWERANLQGLCASCHSQKTRREQLGRVGEGRE